MPDEYNVIPEDELEKILDQIDGSSSRGEYAAYQRLRTLRDRVPMLLSEKYKSANKWQERVTGIYFSFQLAATSRSAFELEILALSDRSRIVQYRACMMLALSQNQEALPKLQELVESTKNEKTLGHALAAIDAIESQNHNYFVDRIHSGKTFLKFVRC